MYQVNVKMDMQVQYVEANQHDQQRSAPWKIVAVLMQHARLVV